MKTRVLIAVCGLAVLFAVWRIASSGLVKGAGSVTPRGQRVLNPETGYQFTIDIGKDFAGWPIECEDTGQKNCYPAEVCRSETCRKDGGEGTWVVLNQWLGKAGETKCPNCGSPVRFHNWDQESAAAAGHEEAEKDKNAKPKPRGRRGRGNG